MTPSFIRYLLLALFLLGVIFIVTIQYNSTSNIDELISNNNKAMKELRFQQKVEWLISDVLDLANRSKASVLANDTLFAASLKEPLDELEVKLQALNAESDNTALNQKFEEFKKIAIAKVVLSKELIAIFQQKGKQAAEQLIVDKSTIVKGRTLLELDMQMSNMRQESLNTVIQKVKTNGDNAKIFGYVLAFFAVISSILAFWYISGKIAEQQRIIEALNISERRIKEASQLKEQFMANISHEIRTPMNAILGFTGLLKKSRLNEEQNQFIDNIHTSGESLLALINDVLDLSKMEAGMVEFENKPFSLHGLVASVTTMFHEKIKAKNLQFLVDIDEKIPDVLSGDSIRLTQIFVNLVNNAIKFTEKGSIRLHIALLNRVDSTVRLKIVVADSGIGIPKAKQAIIFERFHQADLDTTRRFGGTGLGLSIVKQLVELQGGSIQLKSEPDSGSVFNIELEYKVPEISTLEVERPANEIMPLFNNKIKVLIAEDNIMNQQLIRHLMQNWKIDAVIVDNGAEAVKKLTEDNFSLLLMDVQMPQMDGYTATGIIRDELKAKIPIIAMTAHAMSGEKEKCLEMGMNDFISKPINEHLLYNMITQYTHHPNEESNNEREPNNANISKNEEVSGTDEMNLKYVDLNYLRELSGNDKVFEKQMLQQVLVQAPAEVSQLEQAIKKGELINVKRIAHSLKSTIGYIGLSGLLNPPLDNIEKSALSANLEGIVDNFIHIKLNVGEAVKEIDMILQRGSSNAI